MGVLDRLAHRDEQFEPLRGRQPAGIAELCDRRPLHQFHHEVRSPIRRGTCVEYLRNIRVVHHREGLPFGLEAAQHAPRIHTGFNQFECDPPFDRFKLVCDPHLAHTPFANLLQQLVSSRDNTARLLIGRSVYGSLFPNLCYGLFQKLDGFWVG